MIILYSFWPCTTCCFYFRQTFPCQTWCITKKLGIFNWWVDSIFLVFIQPLNFSINLIIPLLLWNAKIGETNYFPSWLIIPLVLYLYIFFGILFLSKLISSSENWKDQVLCCILGALTKFSFVTRGYWQNVWVTRQFSPLS